eukprot:3123167-Prymnesium_polylepis.1
MTPPAAARRAPSRRGSSFLDERQVDRLRRVVRRPTGTALMWMSAGRLSLPESQAALWSVIS